MRMFVCTTIKHPSYSVLSYKSRTIAKYENKELTVCNLKALGNYELDSLRQFIIDECRWLYKALNYPLNAEETKQELQSAAQAGTIKEDIYM